MTRSEACLTTFGVLAALTVFAGPAAGADEARIKELIAKLPVDDRAEADRIAKALVKDAPGSVKRLCGMLVAPGKADDSKARYALYGLVTHCCRPGAQAERKMLVRTFVAELKGRHAPAVKGFLIRQLQLTRDRDAAAAVARFLLDEELSEYAAQALQAMGGEKAAALCRQALARARGKPRLTLVQAAGAFRDARAVALLVRAAEARDRVLRIAARDALGNIGDPAAVDLLLGAADSKDAYERTEGAEAALVLAQRLVEAGKPDPAEQVYAALWKSRTASEEAHVRGAALNGLVGVRGADKVVDEILAAIGSGNPELRAMAVRIAGSSGGEAVTRKWVEMMAKAEEAQAAAAILAILGARRDAEALPVVLAAFQAKDRAVRLAAMKAACAIGGRKAAQALVECLAAKDREERQAARDAMIKMHGNEASAAAAAGVKTLADAGVRRELLGVLAARRASGQLDTIVAAAGDKDSSVRRAALGALGTLAGREQAPLLIEMLQGAKDGGLRGAVERALVAMAPRMAGAMADLAISALKDADPDAAVSLLRVLGKAGGKKAAGTIRSYTGDADAKIRGAAVRALADWQSRDGMEQAAQALLAVAKTAEDPKHHVMALKKYLSLAGSRDFRRSGGQKLAMCAEAIKIAKRVDEKRQALGVAGSVESLDGLKFAASYLGADGLTEEAAATVVRIARSRRLRNMKAPEIRSALEKVIAVSRNKRTIAEAKKRLGGR